MLHMGNTGKKYNMTEKRHNIGRHTPSNKGKICIYNKDTKKYILKEELDIYINNGWMLGDFLHKRDNYRHSEDTRIKISENTRKAMKNPEIITKLKIAAKRNSNKDRFMKVRRKDWNEKTPVENLFLDFMTNNNFKYQRRINLAESFVYSDYANDEYKIWVEFDGKQHDIYKDKTRDNELKKLGWKVLRYTNNYAKNNINNIEQQILEIMSKGGDAINE